MTLDLIVCGARVRVHCAHDTDIRFLSLYYAPCLVPVGGEAALLVRLDSKGVEVLEGPPLVLRTDLSPRNQLEWLLVEFIMFISRGHGLLHAGCVVFRGRVVVFLAPSGSGKSSLTRAALRMKADYVTDDLLLVKEGFLHGFARSIRFKSYTPDERPLPAYLAEMSLVPLGEEGSGQAQVPLWWGGGTAHHRHANPGQGVVVVQVAPGRDGIASVSSVERLVALHESAIAATGEYKGGLGSGWGYSLTWEDPDCAFRLLVDRLEAEGLVHT
jgi:hypothetical protein